MSRWVRPKVLVALVILLVAAWFLRDIAGGAREFLVNLHGPGGGTH